MRGKVLEHGSLPLRTINKVFQLHLFLPLPCEHVAAGTQSCTHRTTWDNGEGLTEEIAASSFSSASYKKEHDLPFKLAV